ncbi:hypothetical protein CK203_054482 [Vitis vinifera]|uniref:Uncharacterized protein n=1 Tax=Vitis vinifera TaxID=29760 RepID=A0A438GB73_VITVI|nr:hypothetical protein CK203_054482 [Vitis vinifera]
MEAARGEKDGGLLRTLRPPRLEDAGLEDCALPPDSIKEAFLKAATAVRSRAGSILTTDNDEDDDGCLNGPWPTATGKGGIPGVMGDEVGAGVTDATKAEEKSDKVVGGELREEGKECVDALQGLKIGEKGKSGVEEEEPDKPVLGADLI